MIDLVIAIGGDAQHSGSGEWQGHSLRWGHEQLSGEDMEFSFDHVKFEMSRRYGVEMSSGLSVLGSGACSGQTYTWSQGVVYVEGSGG